MSEEEKRAINKLKFIIVTDIYDNEVNIDKTKIINEYNESVGIILNLIEKQSKEIEELKEKDDANLAYYDQIYQNGIYTGQKAVEDRIKAILEEYKYTEIGDSEKIIEFYKKMQSLLE